MFPDPIVAEIGRVREDIAVRFGYDIRAIGMDARRRDAASDRKVIRLPPRRPVVFIAKPPQPATAPAVP